MERQPITKGEIERADMLDRIIEMLDYCDGDYIAKTHNMIARIRNTTGSDRINYNLASYKGDNTWEIG